MADKINLILTLISAIAAISSGIFAWRSHKLSLKIRTELKNDERLILSRLVHPEEIRPEHRGCVLSCTLFNQSHRKVYVKNVRAFDSKNEEIEITWSRSVECGNPIKSRDLIGITTNEDLFIRDICGNEIRYCRLEVFHSFSDTPATTIYDEFKDWNEENS